MLSHYFIHIFIVLFIPKHISVKCLRAALNQSKIRIAEGTGAQ